MALRRENVRDEARAAGDDTASERPPEVVNRYPSTGVSAMLLGLFVVFVLGIVALAQNTDGVPFEFLWMEFEPPLFVLLLATVAASSATTILVAAVWRRRRRLARSEHEELQRLRRERETRST